MRRTVGRVGILVVGGAVLGLVVNGARAHGVRLGQKVYANAEAGLCSSPSTTRPSVSVAEASGLRAHPGVAFGDARPAEEYALGHVAGAWHLPCFGNAGAETLAHLGGASTLIVYGQDEAQAEAHRVAEELGRRGFADVRVLSGGWRAWQAAGLPAESGPCDECKKP